MRKLVRQRQPIVFNFIFILDIIHTVGPQGVKPQKLQSCYDTSLNILVQQNLRSVVSLSLLFYRSQKSHDCQRIFPDGFH